MGRPVKVRLSYSADITKLASLCEAIEIDRDRDIDWRTNTCAVLRAAIRMLEKPIPKREVKPER